MPYTKTAWVEGGAPGISAANLNKIEAGIAQAHWYGTTTNAGNAYAVTLNPVPASFAELTGVPIRVQCNVNATGALTINVNGLGVKAVKSSFGVAISNWKAGSIYTLAYNGTDFILQGEGGEYGTVVAADVLAPKTFGTEAGLVAGNIPVSIDHADGINGAAGALSPSDPTKNYIYIMPSRSYFDGTKWVRREVPDLVPGNIKIGVNILGLVGTLSGFPLGNDNLVFAGAVSSNVPSSAYTKVKVITAKVLSAHRAQFSLRSNTTAAAFGRIYKNGVPFGTERTVSGTTYVNFVEDLVFNANDTIELWLKGSGANSAQSTFLALLALMPTITMDT